MTTSDLQPASPAAAAAAATEAELIAVMSAEYPKMVAHHMRMGFGLQDAEDAVQETLADAFRQIRTNNKPILNLKPWLYLVANRKEFSRLRKEEKEREALKEAPWCRSDYGEQNNTNVIKSSKISVQQRQLWSAIQELPERLGEILSLHLNDLSNSEIAEITGIKEATVRSHLRNARDTLSKKLSD